MESWHDGADRKLRQRAQDTAEREQLKLHQISIFRRKFGLMFDDLKESARVAVDEIKAKHPAFAQVSFDGSGPGFTVSNGEYPAETVQVVPLGEAISIARTTIANVLDMRTTHGQIETAIDDDDNLVLQHRGKRLSHLNEVLDLILNPVFRLNA